MNKKLLAIIGAVIVIGIIAFLLMSKGQNNSSQPQTSQTIQTDQTQETAKPTVQPKSLKDLLVLGKTQSCTFSDETNSQSTIFITNNKMKGDFNVTSDGKTIKSHIIVDGQNTYMWMDGQNTGYKMSVDKTTQDQANNQQNSIDMNKQVDYNCKDWTADASVFNLPSGINFTDISKLVAPTGTNTNATQCAVCDTLQGDAKTQCKTALKCN